MSDKRYIDVICPVYYVDLEVFKKCVSSWYKNIPIRKIYIGIGKENIKLENFLWTCPKITMIDQTDYKTLGYCLQELFHWVETEFFIYLHNDVKLTENWFEKMWEERVFGILESQKDPMSFGIQAYKQAERKRAYSGAQLIYKKAIENLKWEDDYVYTTEDLIIQKTIIDLGFEYKKVPIYHKHYIQNAKRTQPRETILDWQWKALIKYTQPNEQLADYIKSIKKILEEKHKTKINLKKFIEKNNKKWNNYI